MSAAAVQLEDLSVGWNGKRVLRNLNLTVPAGTTMALLGASGSGKSTLLRTVAGLLAPIEGRILVAGSDVTDIPAHRRSVGMVFQGQALFPHASVGANITFAAGLRGTSRATRKDLANEWLDRVGMPGMASRDVSTLSGGQRQRVALARTLAAEPLVVLLDEPMAALDTALREDLLAQMRVLFAAQGTTVIHVTHDPAEAQSLATTVAVLVKGKIAQIGPTSDVLRTPASKAIARLLGAPFEGEKPDSAADRRS